MLKICLVVFVIGVAVASAQSALKLKILACEDQYICNVTRTGLCDIECVNKTRVCDGREDCTNGMDEMGCLDSTGPCEGGEFMCNDNTTCVHPRYLCNGFNDCDDGEDEADCPVACFCEEDHYICDNHEACIPIDNYCDGVVDCPSGDDEPGRCLCTCEPEDSPLACSTEYLAPFGVDTDDNDHIVGYMLGLNFTQCMEHCKQIPDCEAVLTFILPTSGEFRCTFLDNEIYTAYVTDFQLDTADVTCDTFFHPVFCP